jgi:hypothetical protein
MGRIASDATFPQKCDHDAVGDAGRPHPRHADARHHESAGQGERVNVGCTRSINAAPDSAASNDRLLWPSQRQRRSDEGRCHQQLVVQLTHSARRQQCSLPVSTPGCRCATFRRPPRTPTRAPPCGMTGRAPAWTGTPLHRRSLHRRRGAVNSIAHPRSLAAPDDGQAARTPLRSPLVTTGVSANRRSARHVLVGDLGTQARR